MRWCCAVCDASSKGLSFAELHREHRMLSTNFLHESWPHKFLNKPCTPIDFAKLLHINQLYMGRVGFEPTTKGLKGPCSTAELPALMFPI